MTDLTKTSTQDIAAASEPPGNPDGKGANGFMLDWYRTEPRAVVAKPQHQVLAEFFTSMLILSAGFKYKPATGVANYLYRLDDEWSLSLIAPEQWSARHRAGFVGKCELQADMTWTIEPSEQLLKKGPLAEAVGQFFDAFTESMDTKLTLEEILPFYIGRLPYWQRLHASALSRSIRTSVTLSGQTSIQARDWRRALPDSGRSLLLQASQPT